jgi:predicted transcriptional regulator
MANDLHELTCPLLSVAHRGLWKQPPLRDITDLMIVVTLLGFARTRKTVNITSIAELTGISRATATRRVGHLVEAGIVSGRRANGGILVGLTEQGTTLAHGLMGKARCAEGRPCAFDRVAMGERDDRGTR